jgi:hypothetical protein
MIEREKLREQAY